MDEARSELDLHALAEGEVAHRLVNELLQLEELGKLVHGRSELSLRDPVDLLKNTEAIGSGDVPHELRAVPHEQRHPTEVGVLAAPGNITQHARLASARMKQPREHLERRRLPRPVRPEKTNDLTGHDAERDAGNRVHIFAMPLHERPQGRRKPLLALRHAKRLAELADVDDGVGHSGMMTALSGARECIICFEHKEADHG